MKLSIHTHKQTKKREKTNHTPPSSVTLDMNNMHASDITLSLYTQQILTYGVPAGEAKNGYFLITCLATLSYFLAVG